MKRGVRKQGAQHPLLLQDPCRGGSSVAPKPAPGLSPQGLGLGGSSSSAREASPSPAYDVEEGEGPLGVTLQPGQSLFDGWAAPDIASFEAGQKRTIRGFKKVGFDHVCSNPELLVFDGRAGGEYDRCVPLKRFGRNCPIRKKRKVGTMRCAAAPLATPR